VEAQGSRRAKGGHGVAKAKPLAICWGSPGDCLPHRVCEVFGEKRERIGGGGIGDRNPGGENAVEPQGWRGRERGTGEKPDGLSPESLGFPQFSRGYPQGESARIGA